MFEGPCINLFWFLLLILHHFLSLFLNVEMTRTKLKFILSHFPYHQGLIIFSCEINTI